MPRPEDPKDRLHVQRRQVLGTEPPPCRLYRIILTQTKRPPLLWAGFQTNYGSSLPFLPLPTGSLHVIWVGFACA